MFGKLLLVCCIVGLTSGNCFHMLGVRYMIEVDYPVL